jgi:hypothetical protein
MGSVVCTNGCNSHAIVDQTAPVETELVKYRNQELTLNKQGEVYFFEFDVSMKDGSVRKARYDHQNRDYVLDIAQQVVDAEIRNGSRTE